MESEVLCTLRKEVCKDKKQIVKYRVQTEGAVALMILGIDETELCASDIAQIGDAYMGGKKVVVYKLGGWNVRPYDKMNMTLAAALNGWVVDDDQIRRATSGESVKVQDTPLSVQRYENEGKALGEMGTMEIFGMCKGKTCKKHGKRGGADYSALNRVYRKKSEVTSRAWKRGEKAMLKKSNAKALQQTIKDERISAAILASRYGVTYRPCACALKVSSK